MHRVLAANLGRGQDLLGLVFVYQMCWDLIWQQHLKICKTRTVLVGENITIDFTIFAHISSR